MHVSARIDVCVCLWMFVCVFLGVSVCLCGCVKFFVLILCLSLFVRIYAQVYMSCLIQFFCVIAVLIPLHIFFLIVRETLLYLFVIVVSIFLIAMCGHVNMFNFYV